MREEQRYFELEVIEAMYDYKEPGLTWLDWEVVANCLKERRARNISLGLGVRDSEHIENALRFIFYYRLSERPRFNDGKIPDLVPNVECVINVLDEIEHYDCGMEEEFHIEERDE